MAKIKQFEAFTKIAVAYNKKLGVLCPISTSFF